MIEWKTGADGRKTRVNIDGSSHYCKSCKYCDKLIEYRNGVYVNIDDLKKHTCEQYFKAINKDVKEIEETGKLVAEVGITSSKPKLAPTTKTAYEMQQDKRSEDIKLAHNENMDVAKAQIEVLNNLGLTLGEINESLTNLIIAIRENTMQMINQESDRT